MKRLLAVVGTRPNFIKVTRLKQVARDRGGIEVRLLHTGQHADARMSAVFFEEFGLAPDERLEVPECSAAARMGRLMLALEPAMRAARPDAVLVVGDVDSTLAAAITANKLGLPLAHLESGLRSGDREMPEELNRILTDRITDLLLVTEPSGAENLIREGISEDRIHQVGNAMIDTLVAFDDRIQSSNVLERLGLGTGGHALITIHRPSNVDSTESLARVVDLIAAIAETCKAVFPIHPRTLRGLEASGQIQRLRESRQVVLCEPLGYFDFQKLLATSAVVITDSGGVQEETTYRGIPCLTLRPSTERPITITEGTNELLAFDAGALREAMSRIRSGRFKHGRVPHLWDGHATERVIDALNRAF